MRAAAISVRILMIPAKEDQSINFIFNVA